MSTSMLISVRPSRLFAKVEEEGAARVVQIRIPKRRNMNGPDNSPTMLETMVLLAAAKAVRARTIFEFGTCLGHTTVNLALNLPSGGRIYTLDLDPEAQQEATQNDLDRANTDFRFTMPMEWDYEGFALGDVIKPLLGDSTKLENFPEVDMVWIDGGHDLLTVSSDTTNALGMDPLCIAWHDYHNLESPDVTEAVDAFAEDFKVYRVEDTSICLWFRNLEL